MRKVFCCILLLIVALVLSGCECEHQWTDADCVNSQFCSLCQETGQDALGHDYAAATCTEPETCTRCFKTRGEVLGHDYAPATCTEPETCTRCAATSGEALGHAFADWYFYEPLMSHTCETCGLCRTAPIDRELYLGTLLAGHWDVITFTYDEQTYTMNDYAKVDFGYAEMGCTFTEDKTLQFTGPNGLVMKGTWRLDECILEDGAVLYSMKITFTQIPNEVSAESTALMFLFDAKDQEDSLYFVVGDIWVELSKNSRYVSEVVGNWGIGDNGWGTRTGNCAFWLSFQPDRTVTGYMDGPIEGTWHLEPLGNNCGIYVKYEKDEETEWLQLLFSPGKEDTGPTLRPLDARGVKFIKVSEAELDVIKLPTEVFASTWKIQSYMSSDNKQVPVDEQTSNYSITFCPDGTFIAFLGREYTGRWEIDSYSTPDDGIWKSFVYYYELHFDGQKKTVGGSLNVRSTDYYAVFHKLPGVAYTYLEFMPNPDFNIYERSASDLLGTWEARRISDLPEGSENVVLSEYTITFHENGTFTARLGSEISGTWKESDLKDRYAELYRSDDLTIFRQLNVIHASDGDTLFLELFLSIQYPDHTIRIHMYKVEDPAE